MDATRRDLHELVVQLSPTGLLVVDQHGIIRLANPRIEALFGYSGQELIGQAVEVLIPEAVRAQHPALREGFFSQPTPRYMGKNRHLFGRHKNGNRVPVEVGLQPGRLDGESVVLASVANITDRTQADSRFQAAVDSSPSGMIMTTREGRILMVNREVEKLFQYSRDELVGLSVETLIPARFRASHPELREQFYQSPNSRPMGSGRDLYGLRRDGTEIPIEIGLNPIETPEGLCVLASVVDISERKQAEQQVRQSQKMETIGNLASGIAHDFNNILLSILGHAEFLLPAFPPGSAEHKDVNQVITATQRGKQLVDRILSFSRQAAVARTSVDPAQSVREAIAFLRASLPTSVAIEETLAHDLPSVHSEQTLLHQVVINLVTNAAQAMPSGGGVRLRLFEQWLDQANDEDQSGELGSGHYIVLQVEDDGPGMTEEIQAQVFEPFFTTKPEGEGTGLGLSIVKNIVESHQGQITLQSAPGQGCTFTVLLPADGETVPAQEGVRQPGVEQLPGHVLAVDDEPVLATLLERHLEQIGYPADTFTSSLDALDAFKRQPDRYRLLITDNVMPGLTGKALAEHVRSLDSELPILFLSGNLDPDTEQALEELGRVRTLPKPYMQSELREILADLVRDAAE